MSSLVPSAATAMMRFEDALQRILATSRHRVLFVGHAWGGGVQRHMQDLARALAGECHALVARPGPGGTVQVELGGADDAPRAYFALPAELDALLAFLGGLALTRVHFHHVHGLPRAMLELPQRLGIPHEWTLHDYYALFGPSPVSSDGEPARSPEGGEGLPTQLPFDLSLGEWRQLFGTSLRQAARVIAPSHDVARRFHKVWPDLAISVWPHPEWRPERGVDPVRVLTLGRISPEKGLRVLLGCAQLAREQRLPLFFRVLGCTTEVVLQAPHLPLSVSGEYPERALAELVAVERPDVLFFPTQVPETYGYTLSVAMTTGAPVVASAIGAYPERLAPYGKAALLPPNAPPTAWVEAMLALAPARESARAIDIAIGTPPEEYCARYLRGLGATIGSPTPAPLPPRFLERPPVDVIAELGSLRSLFVTGVECGQLESRNELRRRIDLVATERAGIAREREEALQAQQNAQRRADHLEHSLRIARSRIDELEHSTSWRITGPVRVVGHQWKLVKARFRATYATAKHVPRQADVARTIWRDHGAGALITRVWAKLSGKRRYRPPAVTRYSQETQIVPLSFGPLSPLPPRVSIVIPVYGKPLVTYTCLKSVLAHTPAGRYEVIVVDDGSPEPMDESLKEVRGVRFERSPSNAGFVASCNRGAALARGELLLFLNNDTIVTPGWLQAILEAFERRPQAGLVGAKLVYPDGRLQEAGGIVWRDGSGWNCGRDDDPERPEHNYVREVDYCSGACIAVPSAVFRAVGGFDARYAPAYYEDTDLAFAVRALGRKVVYQPRATVVHFEGQTAGTDVGSGVKSHQLVNQQRFAEKWSAVLAAHRGNGVHPELERDRYARHRVLVIDACMLTPDQDSGSVRMQAILELLTDLQCKVTFVADSLEHRQPYVSDLQQRGIEVLFHPYVRSVPSLLAERGDEFDVIVISRHYIAAKHIQAVRSFAPQALLVFDTVDLHFLRAERLAELEGGAMGKAAARGKREEELGLIREADVTMVVSTTERALLSRLAPDAEVALLSNIHDVIPGGRPFAEREGLVFIGGFQHPPNADAVLWYAQEVLPHVRKLLPDVTTYIVGADPPATVRELAAPDLVVTGHVPDIAPYFTRCRASISPLRYGAGVKGKVNLALSYGLPVVATTPSVEAMFLTPEENVLVADDPRAFAAAIARVYRDEALWNRISEGGREVIRQHFSREVARSALAALLARTPKQVRGSAKRAAAVTAA